MDISVLVPVYNESVVLETVLNDLLSILPKTQKDWEILIIDDASTDTTQKTAERLSKKHKQIKVLRHPYNKGYGASLKTGAKEAKGEWLILFDGDNQFYAKDILQFLQFQKNHDMILGARRGQKDVLRAPGKIILTKFASFLASEKIADLNCGFRLVKRSLFMRFWNLYPQRFSITSTLTMAAIRSGYNVKWVPIEWKPRRSGKSSMKVVRDGMRFMLLMVRMTMLFAPLRVFVPVSVVLFFAGVAYGAYTVYALHNIGDFSTLTVLSSLFVMLFGLVADQLANIRRDLV